MKKIVLVYGVISGALIVGISTLIFVIFGKESTHAQNEFLGYLVMILSLSIIFMGVKKYRDQHLGGIIKFGRAFVIGLYITLIASGIYVTVWEIYIQSSDDTFIENYARTYIEQLEADGASEELIEIKKAEMEAMIETYGNPFFRVGITFLEIFPVGLIITILSAFFWRNSTILPPDQTKNTEGATL